MKITITLLLIGFTTFSFGQSKKAVNKQLKYELSWFQNVYDSLFENFQENERDERMLKEDILKAEHNFRNQLIAIDDLWSEISHVKKDIFALGGNPDQLVSENELNVIFSLVTPMNYGDKVRELNETPIPPVVATLPDISDEKVKVQNELLQAKIDAYKQTYSQYELLIQQQKITLGKLNRLKTSVQDQLGIAAKVKMKLEEKSVLLANNLHDLEEKHEAEQQKKLEEEAAKAAKKNKNSTIRFVPPVIVKYEEEEEGPENDAVYLTSGEDFKNEVSKEIAEEPEYSNAKKDTVFYVVDQMPEFPSGRAAFQKYLADNLKYPPSAIEKGIMGKVYIKFVVSSTGDVSNVTVARGIPGCLECDAEAYRVISQMPKWKPAQNNGKAVPCYYTMPIVFKLD